MFRWLAKLRQSHHGRQIVNGKRPRGRTTEIKQDMKRLYELYREMKEEDARSRKYDEREAERKRIAWEKALYSNPGDMGNAIVSGTTLLTVRHFRNGEEVQDSRREIWNRVVTNTGVGAIATGTAITAWNFHDCGTGTTAEAATQSALVTPVTEARVTGAQSNPSNGVYRSVATITSTNAYAITEHGLFTQSAKPGGVLLDRTLFAAINVISGDSISFTFDLTFASGG